VIWWSTVLLRTFVPRRLRRVFLVFREARWLVPAWRCFTLPLAVPTHFFLTWLLLRVKFTEALVAWLFQGGVTLLSIGILALLWFGEKAILPRLVG